MAGLGATMSRRKPSQYDKESLVQVLEDIVAQGAQNEDEEYGVTLIQRAIANRIEILALKRLDAQCVLDVIQRWLDRTAFDHPLRQRAIYLLVKIAEYSQEFPPSLFLHDINLCPQREPDLRGGFADLFLAQLNHVDVAVKRLRISSQQHKASLYPRFCREALIWRQFRHPSILPFLGIDRDTFRATDRLCMVSLWMPNGTIRDFVRSSQCNPLLHRDSLLFEVASGLHYLHAQDIVHGDINDVNILVDYDYHARVADFGLSLVGVDNNFDITTSGTGAGNVRWRAPEFHHMSANRCTFAGDLWAFGCLCLSIYTRDRPYASLNDTGVLLEVMAGRHPERPTSKECHGMPMSDLLWSLVQRCWNPSPIERPNMAEVLTYFEERDYVCVDFSESPGGGSEPSPQLQQRTSYMSIGSSQSSESLKRSGSLPKPTCPELDFPWPPETKKSKKGLWKSIQDDVMASGKLFSLATASLIAFDTKRESTKLTKQDEDALADMARRINHIVTAAFIDWDYIHDLCERASSSELLAFGAAETLQHQLKYGSPQCQMMAAKIWAIMAQRCSDKFLDQCSTSKFLDDVERLIFYPSTQPVVKDRLLTVLAGVTYISLKRGHRGNSSYQALWKRVKSAQQPAEGFSFGEEDNIFEG